MIEINNLISKIKKYYDGTVDVGLILGSGLDSALPQIDIICEIPYENIGLNKSKVKGHIGKLVIGKYKGITIMSMCRIHYYEYGNFEYSNIPFQILHALGGKVIIMTTAVGGCNDNLKPGDLVLIKDHINLTGDNSIIGMNEIKFIDMSDAYCEQLRYRVKQITLENNIEVREGIHVQTSGPSYETPAEIKFIRMIGGDTVSMSTATDTIICNYLGIKVLAFASVSNMAAGLKDEILNHDDVLRIGKENSNKLKIILENILNKEILGE